MDHGLTKEVVVGVRLLSVLVVQDVKWNRFGELSLDGVFATLYAPAFPAEADRVVIATTWFLPADTDGPARATGRVQVLTPDESTVLAEDAGDMSLAPGQFFTHLTELVGVQFPAAGDYPVVVELDGREVARFPIMVREEQARPAQESHRPSSIVHGQSTIGGDA